MSRVQSYSNLPYLSEVPERGGVLRNKSNMNTLLPVDRTQFTKKLPMKSTSFQTSFRGSTGSILADVNENRQSLSKSNHNRPMAYRASQKGRGDLLPTIAASKSEGYTSDQGWNSNPNPTTYRATEKGNSDILPTSSRNIDGYTSDHSWNKNRPLTTVKTISQKLLRRRTASVEVHNSDDSSHRQNGKKSLLDYYYQTQKNRNILQKFGSNLWILFKKSEWTQIIIFCCVFYFVYDSYVKLITTSGQLQKLKDDEGMMMLHLHRIEQQSIHLHESIAKIGDINGHTHEASTEESLSSEDNQIHTQTQQLYEMEQELDHELRALQAKLQQAARSSITSKYGDGPIKVVLEMDLPDESSDQSSNAISILLWYDTPHAAWTWLKQIQVGEWNGSEFKVGDLSSIDAQPVIYNAGTLDFLERSQKNHEPWTVGLSNSEGNLNMFINLKDNSEERQYTVCVGKVIDGFDVIQKMLTVSQKDDARPIRIRQATAAQLTRETKSQQ
jgi:cyclophilin family peptidyl-prolyl cis-trans isomerase